jgi:hypothetical protein
VKAWAEAAITTVLLLEYQRAKHLKDRQLSQKQRRWWETQRLRGGIAKLQRLLPLQFHQNTGHPCN